MKLYMHPVSTVSRPVRLFIAETGIKLDEQVVDLMTGEHLGAAYQAINPNSMVPMLEDGDFRLTESSAILKYLADVVESPAYPKDLKKRAKINEMMDWLNTNLYRDFGYNLVYPQIFPHHRRRSEEAQAATVAWGQERTRNWLRILDQHFIGPDKTYLCGDSITLADYFGAGLISIGEIVRCDFADYPNIRRWMAAMKRLPSWPKVNEAFYGFVDAVKAQPFVAA